MTQPIEFPFVDRLTIKVSPRDIPKKTRVVITFETSLNVNHISEVLDLVSRGQAMTVAISSPQAEMPLEPQEPEDYPVARRRRGRKGTE